VVLSFLLAKNLVVISFLDSLYKEYIILFLAYIFKEFRYF